MFSLSKAYSYINSMGDIHMRTFSESLPISSNFWLLVISLATGNTFKLEINKQKSKPINMFHDVARESLLSPIPFNLCQDFVIKKIPH